jgi:hypothetical protein
MPVRFASSYVDRLFAERNMVGLHHLISVIEPDRALPDEFWLFCRLLEWVGSTRSGVWQYYEGLSEQTYDRMSHALDRFGLDQIAERYRFGRTAWSGPDQAASLDEWIDEHEAEIESAALDLISRQKACLNDES